MNNKFKVTFDARGREILDPMPAAFVVPAPDQRRISTLDFHRAKLLEQREIMRRMLEDMKADSEHETLAEANDFRVEDPLDEEASHSDFELDDDDLDVVEAISREAYNSAMATTAKQNQQTVTVTDKGSPSETAE